jgi:iron(III) transport system ATP-binding protein
MLMLNDLSVTYQNKVAVQGVSLALAKGQIGCLLGPSGCGKTSVLRAIAGFEQAAAGSIFLRDHKVADENINLSTTERKVAVVFQDYALFPHFTVAQNIAFGLHQSSKAQQHRRVSELLELVGLPGLQNAYPHGLSGGQQQRIALARAIASKPDLLLLDEPFSSLDRELREELAKELRVILKHENTTALMVTHDQHEAFAMADVIGVMQHGQLLQWATAYTLYHQPAARFVADFIGDGVFMAATVNEDGLLASQLGTFAMDKGHQFAPDQPLTFLVRPDDIVHDDDSHTRAQVIDWAFRGSHILYDLMLQNAQQDRVLCLALSHHHHQVGELIGIRLDLQHLIVFAAD